jgi:hypothetical protein
VGSYKRLRLGYIDLLAGCIQWSFGSVKWDWETWTCTHAAVNGHLKVIQWARENGCDWDSRTCTECACCGHLEVLQWALANG